jgi:hypothetical protein
LPRRQDRATKLLTYIGEIIVNGHKDVRAKGTTRQTDREARGAMVALASSAEGTGSSTTSIPHLSWLEHLLNSEFSATREGFHVTSITSISTPLNR